MYRKNNYQGMEKMKYFSQVQSFMKFITGHPGKNVSYIII